MYTAIPAFIILTGSLIFLCGYLLRFRRKMELLLLYDPKATLDKKGLARWAGNNLMIMACLQAACGVGGFMSGQLLWMVLAFLAITLVMIIILALGTAEYSKTSI
jgi:hypothetical protein